MPGSTSGATTPSRPTSPPTPPCSSTSSTSSNAVDTRDPRLRHASQPPFVHLVSSRACLPKQAKRGRAFHFSPAAYYYSYMYLLFLTMSLDPATLLHVPSTQALSYAPNSLRIRRSEKSTCNSFRMRRSIL